VDSACRAYTFWLSATAIPLFPLSPARAHTTSGGGFGNLSSKKPRCVGKQNLDAADKGGGRQEDGGTGGRAGGREVGEDSGAKPCLSEDEVFFCLSLSVCLTVSIRAY
jgi:hypothetical protein